MANLSSVLAQAAANHGERPAVRLDRLVLSYSQLRDAAGRAASLVGRVLVAGGHLVLVALHAIGRLRVSRTLARRPGCDVRFPILC